MRSITRWLAVFFVFIFSASLYAWPKKMVVIVPVADLRSERSIATDLNHSTFDMKQLSQLLFGEKIIADKKVDGYLHVFAIEQQVYNKDKNYFIGCPGWIKSDQAVEVDDFPEYNFVVIVPSATILYESKDEEMLKILLGTELCGELGEDGFLSIVLPNGKAKIDSTRVECKETFCTLDEDSLRSTICKISELFLNGLYTWGGRSIYDEALEAKGQLTGVDCSSLIALCYKICGIQIPRNSRSQHMKCIQLAKGKELKPADIVFTAKKSLLDKIGHVMLYLGNDSFIESVGGQIRKVVRVSGQTRFGKKVAKLKNGEVTQYGKVYFGTFFGNA